MKKFYIGHGFKELEPTPDSASMHFVYNLGNDIKKEPQYFKEIDSEIDQEIVNSN